MAKQNEEQSGLFNFKAIAAIIALLAVAAYGISVYLPYTRGLEPLANDAEMSEGPPPDMRERMKTIATEAGITPEQQSKIEKTMMNPSLSREERRAAMDQLITPQQQQVVREKMGSEMRARMQARMERASKKLSPEGQKALQARAERMRQRFGRGGPGGGPGGQGGPPPPSR